MTTRSSNFNKSNDEYALARLLTTSQAYPPPVQPELASLRSRRPKESHTVLEWASRVELPFGVLPKRTKERRKVLCNFYGFFRPLSIFFGSAFCAGGANAPPRAYAEKFARTAVWGLSRKERKNDEKCSAIFMVFSSSFDFFRLSLLNMGRKRTAARLRREIRSYCGLGF